MANSYPAAGTGNFSSTTLFGITAGWVTFSAPATVTTYQLVWPSAQATAGQQLQNDGSGNLSWADSAGGAVTTMGAFGSVPNANGGSIASDTLTLQPADATHPGGVSITTQTFAGAKTFTGQVGIGDVTGGNVVLAVRSGTGTTTANQAGVYVDASFNTVVATNSIRCFVAAPTTAATAGTCAALHGYYANSASLGATSTVTRLINYGGITQTAGVSNCFLSDNITFSGNFAINLTNANPSLINGDFKLNTAGNGVYVKEGSNATMGTGTLNGSTEVTISTTKVTASSRIFLSIQAPGGTPLGVIYVSARSAGVSFGVKGAATDLSTFAWVIVEPA